MILQKLYDDCDIILRQANRGNSGTGLPPSGYVPKAVRWYVDINGNDEPKIQPLSGMVPDSKKDKGAIHNMPECKRAGTVVRPFLFADTATYVFGVNRDISKTDGRLDAKHEAFVRLARACADTTQNPLAQAVVSLLEDEKAMASLRLKIEDRLDSTHTITFKVGGKFVVAEPAVQAYWAKVAAGTVETEEDALPITREPMCLLSGISGPVEEMMPITVKGLFGGSPIGTHLVSGNFAAMESHGWKRSQSSPISRGAGERFGQALNALLASEKHRRRLAASTYVFWAGKSEDPIFVLAFAEASELNPETVYRLLDAPKAGKRFYSDLDSDTPFYAFGLLPNVARIAVRSALALTVDQLENAQRDWFARLRVPAFDDKGQPIDLKPLPLKTLTVAGYRDFKDVPASVEDALVRCALLGVVQAPLPLSLLNAVVLRCRAEQKVNYPQAALLKFYLTQDKDLKIAELMENEVTDNLPTDTVAQPGFSPLQNTAYHLGRLFSELEAIQAQAIPGANATIADRFYGSASSTPASVFGILLDGAQNHLGKIRKDRAGAYAGAQKRLEEILALIEGFPKTLTLPDQALFSLGYYHHRAAKRKEISERSAAKRTALAAQTTLEGTETPSADTDMTDFEGDNN